MIRRAAFLFPGQLSESVGIGRDFYEADPSARDLFALTSERCGLDLKTILFEGPESALHENLAAQAGVYLVSTLASRALSRTGVPPPATAGYSLGNYAALVAAQGISYEEGLEILIAVWRETERLGLRGAMGALVGVRREAVEETCADLRRKGLRVWIGNVNTSTQFVVTGEADAVGEALEALKPRSLSVLPLPMTWPIHSEMMRPVADAIAPLVDGCRTIRDPAVPYYGPDGSRARTGEEIRRILGTGFCRPTIWNATFESMVSDGFRAFLEVGPGEMLSKMSRWNDRSVRCVPAGSIEAISRAMDILSTT